jgi:EAL domain-containing protein (putative c-di-GMP-specific phosphodiesterase class I)
LSALHRLTSGSLSLEITESALMEDPETALAHLARLAALGVRLSVDDYGAGQASLAYVKTLPIHELKIDRMFVRSLASSPKDAAIVQSTVALGHALGLAVVAEGVETEADLAWLRQTGCDIAQGYWLAKPMPVEEFEHWLDAWQRSQGRGLTASLTD